MNKLLETEKLDYLKSSKELSECMDDTFKISFILNQISMDGSNKATYEDVVNTLDNKKTKLSERETKEIINSYKSFDKIYNLINSDTVLDEDILKDIHDQVVEDIIEGGTYRNVNIQIFGALHQPPNHIKVYLKMKRYFDRLRELSGIEKATYAHAELAKIHPFIDANGRVTRLILNYFLLREGYVPVIIEVSDRNEYFKRLDIYKVEKNIIPLQEYFEELLIKRYNQLNK